MDVSEAISCLYNKQGSIYDQLDWMNNNENVGMEVDLFSNVGEQSDGLASLYSQPPEESQSGQFWLAMLERLDCNFSGSSNMVTIPSHDSNILQPLPLDDHTSVNVNKIGKMHASEIANILPRNNSVQHLMRHTSLKEQKMLHFHDHIKPQEKTYSVQKIPRKKCHKVANKITALQKIVSPYGKADTASVLHEASVFIKVLLKEIQILTGEERSQKKQVDLQTKGLCLVPASIMNKFIEEESAVLYSSMPA